MIERIIEFSVKNKLLVFIVTACLVGMAFWCLKNIPLDAIPDLSDTQVIVYSRWEKSPDIIEDQVTYPIISSLLGAPKVKSIRGFSDFGYSYVYVIFEEETDLYWARSRVTEYLSKILSSLPEGVKTELGPDATGVGWVFQYALVDKSGQHSLADLRAYQDWNLRYQLQSVEGVAEVASLGGFEKQYQVNIDPNRLLATNIPLNTVIEAIRKSNNDSGGRLLEMSGREYMVRVKGYLKTIEDIENISLKTDEKTGWPVLLKHVARVEIGPEIKRGLEDLDGLGDTVSGIVVMRTGENALRVIERVKERLKEVVLPKGVELVVTYDRSDLILKAIQTLKHTLIDEIIIVSLIILVFLWHVPSAIIPIITIPVSVLLAFIPFYFMGLTTNIMSLAGIAISIGVLVDGAIVEVENAYKRLEEWLHGGRKGDFHLVRLNALKEVGPSVFFSLLVIAVSFLPIFTLVDQEGRLFKPLAYSKNLAMLGAALLAITLDPALRMLFTRLDPFRFKNKVFNKLANTVFVGTYYKEENHPISRLLFKLYEPVCRFVLKRRKQTLLVAFLLVLSTIPVFLKLGSEFMPPLNEGAILYMPTTLPGISVTEAQKILEEQDKILKSFPEVERVFGKAGRANSSTDPAPLSMVETTVILKPESEWRDVKRWYSFLPHILQTPFHHLWRNKISYEDLINEMNQNMQIPGFTNAWTMPIKNRLDMLSTGIRTPVGVKIYGADLKEIEKIGKEVEKLLNSVKGTRSVFAERVAGGYYVDYVLNRTQMARYNISVEEVQMILSSAIGGENLSTLVLGRERFPLNLRYTRDFRDSIEDLSRVLVPTESGAQIPIGQLASLQVVMAPSMIRNEDGWLSGYVYVDVAGRDIGTYVEESKKILEQHIQLPQGYSIRFSGQYENMLRVKNRLKLILPLTLLLIFFLLYMNTKSVFKTCLVMLAVPFSLIGAIWLIYLLGYNLSIAVWVGMIALMGLDAETGVFMLLFLDLSYDEYKKKGLLVNKENLTEAIVHGAVKRIRPKMMTVMAAMMGLTPIMWSMGTGADVMKRIAAPMVGGLVTSFVLELLIYPVIYSMWKEKEFAK